MKAYYVESIINKIACEIHKLEAQNSFTEDNKLLIYDLDTFSFGIKTILSNKGYQIEGFISDDEIKLMQIRRSMKAAMSRYARTMKDSISLMKTDERLLPFDSNVRILVAAKNYQQVKDKLVLLGYIENQHFFCVCDWQQDEFVENMKGKQRLVLSEVKNREKKMLELVDQFCRDKGIRYWVCGGTLLGTIRHSGFIPWDDDIDIFMPWSDYQRFIKEFQESEDYVLIGPHNGNREDYFELFCKVLDKKTIVREDSGFVRKVHPVAIDVFPLIGLPNDSKEREYFFARYYELEKEIWEDFYAHNGDLKVYNQWYSKQETFLKKYDFDTAEYVGVLATAYKEKDCTTRRVYEETLRMPFEDIEVNVSAGYKEYLDKLYGKDWMLLTD